jgi:phosphohistidine phosphatase
MRLWLLRHAKSSWSDAGLPDEDRPLASRGEHAADRMREYLDAEGIHPALGTDLEVRIEPAMYTFDADVILDRLGRISSDVHSVLVVGHNPAIEDLATRIADRGDGLNDLSQKYPTAGLAEIAFTEGTWSMLADRPGELVRFVVPRHLGDHG